MDLGQMERIVKEAMSVGRKSLVEPEAKELLRSASIPVAPFKVVKDVAGALDAAREIGYPVVLKLVSPDILHKSDVGGVALNIKTPAEIEENWSEMIIELADEYPAALIEGFMVEKMVPRGAEVIVGGVLDEQFGPAVMFGLGGVAVELLKDVSFRIAPVTRDEAFEMMGEVKSFPLLAGYRGAGFKDLDAIADVIMRVGNIMSKVDGLQELEINPLIVYERGAVAVDARAVVR